MVGLPEEVIASLILASLVPFSSPLFQIEGAFPPFEKYVHALSIVRPPNGELFMVWFQGIGERNADDVCIMGSRKINGSWVEHFVIMDYPGFPDINLVLFPDRDGKPRLFWYTVLTNLWESSLLRYAYTHDYSGMGSHKWEWQDVVIFKYEGLSDGIKKDDYFYTIYEKKLREFMNRYLEEIKVIPGCTEEKAKELADAFLKDQLDKVCGRKASLREGHPLLQRIRWRINNRVISANGKILLPLYSDGLEISVIVITEDGGKSWEFGEPIVGIANIQPTLFLKKDGTLVAYMRNNGPPPKRLYMSTSKDAGKTWSDVKYTDIPNPGSRADGIALKDGNGHRLQRSGKGQIQTLRFGARLRG